MTLGRNEEKSVEGKGAGGVVLETEQEGGEEGRSRDRKDEGTKTVGLMEVVIHMSSGDASLFCDTQSRGLCRTTDIFLDTSS